MGQTRLKIGVYLIAALSVWSLLAPAASAESSTATLVEQDQTALSESDPLSAPMFVKERDVDVREMLDAIFRAMGVGYLLTDDVSGRVYLGQRDATARDILDLVCSAKGLHWWKNGDTYVVGAQPPPVTTDRVASHAASGAGPGEESSQVRKTRQYRVQYWNPRDIAACFNPREKGGLEGRLWSMDYTAFFADQLINAGKPSTSPGQREFTDTSLKPFSDILGNNRLGESRAMGGIGGLRGGFGRAPGIPEARSLGEPLDTGVTGIEEELLESGIDIGAPFAALLPLGMTAPIAYEPLNMLIFEATDEAYDRFLELVRMFDQKPKQVLLEVQFITMNTSDAFALGLDWYWHVARSSVNAAGLAPAGFFTIRTARDRNFGATLSVLLTTGKARLVSSPRIATMNNFPATISFVDQIPYVEFSGGGAFPGGPTIPPGATVLTKNVPTQLTILPRINGDDSVTAILNPQISTYEFVSVPTPEGGTQNVPLVSSNSLSTLLNIKDGETMVIGGFVNRDETVNRSKVPLLGDLPIIGNLFFTRTERNIGDSELLIFVTPHVIRDEAAEVTLGPY